MNLYRENKLPKVSIVINDVKNKPGYGYYGYGRYGYGYGYGYGSSYYEEEKPPLSFFEKIMVRFKSAEMVPRGEGNKSIHFFIMRILVTGGAGFIGSNLAEKLLRMNG